MSCWNAARIVDAALLVCEVAGERVPAPTVDFVGGDEMAACLPPHGAGAQQHIECISPPIGGLHWLPAGRPSAVLGGGNEWCVPEKGSSLARLRHSGKALLTELSTTRNRKKKAAKTSFRQVDDQALPNGMLRQSIDMEWKIMAAGAAAWADMPRSLAGGGGVWHGGPGLASLARGAAWFGRAADGGSDSA